jgi:hypothetical protein
MQDFHPITHLLLEVRGGQVDIAFCRRLKNIPAFRRLYRGSVNARSYVETLESCLAHIPEPPVDQARRA